MVVDGNVDGVLVAVGAVVVPEKYVLPDGATIVLTRAVLHAADTAHELHVEPPHVGHVVLPPMVDGTVNVDDVPAGQYAA